MSTIDKSKAMSMLRGWQDKLLKDYGCQPSFKRKGPDNVTILCYFYRPLQQASVEFPYTACAIFETWRHCGMMKTILVTNAISPAVAEFQSNYANWVSVQIEPDLIPGNINAMSIDCNSKLHSRFKSPYVLIVQDDGFPLRPGLERFIGKHDYLGSPFRRRNLLGRTAAFLLKHCPANGGFSLRTKKICQLASEYWHRYYANAPFGSEQVEDIFYTDTLPRRSMAYRLKTHIADPLTASDFCYDGCVPENFIAHPFGFHSARAFQRLKAEGLIAE